VIQVHSDAAEAVGAKRTVRTTSLIVGVEHKVIHDELAASREKFGQRLSAVGSLKHVFLDDGFPGEIALKVAYFFP
jgi:hypothetical protein